MNKAKISIMVLGVALVMFMIAPAASAQYTPDMLGGKWFKVKASWKGYNDYNADEITGASSGATGNIYIYTSYDSSVPGSEYYTLRACSPDKNGKYWPYTTDLIYREYIYGDSYQKQVWDFYYYSRMRGQYLTLYGGSDYEYYTVPVLVMDIKLDGNGAFNGAKLKSTACLGDFYVGGIYNVGSCSLSGKIVDETKVPQAVKDACGP